MHVFDVSMFEIYWSQLLFVHYPSSVIRNTFIQSEAHLYCIISFIFLLGIDIADPDSIQYSYEINNETFKVLNI